MLSNERDEHVSSDKHLSELSHNIANMSSSNNKRSSKRYLTEQERLEIIRKLSRPNPPSKRSLAREYNINEKAVRKIWSKKDDIEQRSSLMTAAAKSLTFQVPFVGLDALYEQMLALEDQLLCKGFQDKVGEKYDKIICPFSVCLSRLREATMDDKRQRVARMRQSTLHDAWNTR